MASDDHGPWLTLAMIIFLTWAILFYAVRLWAKLRIKTIGADDWAVTGALILSIACQGIMHSAVSKGYGKRSDSLSADALDSINKRIYIGQFFYIVSVGLTRVASAFLVEQVAQHGPHTRPARMLAGLSGTWALLCLLMTAIRPPFSSPWIAVDGGRTMFWRWLAIEIGGLVVEIALWALVIRLVWSLQMQLSKRSLIVAVFGFRLLLLPIVITRLYYLAPSNNDDLNQSSIIAAIYTAAALQFSIVATSFTALKPFLTVFRQPVVAYGSIGGIFGPSANPGEPGCKLKLFHRVKHGPQGSDHSATWRPDQGSAQQSITAQPGRAVTRKRRDDTDDDRESLHNSCMNLPRRATNRVMEDSVSTQTDESDRMIVQRTTEVTVFYEHNKPAGVSGEV
ncbi:hypothetical protein ARSEF1564_001556 [Beauveria bassiana]